MIEELTNCFQKSNEYKALLNDVNHHRFPCLVTGLCESIRPFIISSLLKSSSDKAVVIVPEEKDAFNLKKVFDLFFERVLVYPSRDFIFENISTYSKEWEYERLSVLKNVLSGQFDVVITVPDALMQYTIPDQVLLSETISLKLGDQCSISSLCDRLVSLGYTKAEIVEGPGQFSCRGGILDVFTPQNRYPVRIDFFGDEIDLIGYFDILNQRTIDNATACEILPCGEMVYGNGSIERLTEELSELNSRSFLYEKYHSQISEELERVREKNHLLFPDRYYGVLYENSFSLLDVLKDATHFVVDFKRCLDRAHGFYSENYDALEKLAENNLLNLKHGLPFMTVDDYIEYLQHDSVVFELFQTNNLCLPINKCHSIESNNLVSVGNDSKRFVSDVEAFIHEDNCVYLVSSNDHCLDNLSSLLSQNNVPVRSGMGFDKGVVHCCVADFGPGIKGFSLPSAHFVLITDSINQMEWSVTSKRKHRSSKEERIVTYSDLVAGDLVVHVNHGIGRFSGIQNLTVAGTSRDYIKLVYADNGILYVPCDQLELVSKYIGPENAKLNKLGGAEWKRAKIRAKTAASNIAKDLIKLYAERKNIKGFSFPEDDEFQYEFESNFEFDETDGQIVASKEIKRDMENGYPMDRLLCGDVGFGKTEVALRAAFKCIFAGKQVAFLVPTTILAYQHYQTICSRFRGYPIEIGMLSRFVSKKEQTAYIEKIKTGEMNIVVGTHRLLQQDISFRNLGLLIVDEEQRFGVSHKEKLKQLSKNIDVLTLTATPIPRTLNMALSGIRDMSILEEAPTDRVPVQTFVLEHDDDVITNAIRRELRRGGQVFYLHNFVDSIVSKAYQLKQRFPEQNIEIAHGQMDKETLSRVWQRMISGEIDILVCTTIIETGVNIPNANTLIIEEANRMGLSQLHQIRGRVGRSSRKAYAYLTYRKDSILSDIAEKRLQAIREFTEFGSGFKIAMRDLELRGAGNVLGAEQSGHMEAIGYDLYVKILEDAVNAEKGIEAKAERNCIIDLPVDAFIPETYIQSAKIRMDMYRKIVTVSSFDDQKDLVDELVDRFGEPPAPVNNLVHISMIRHMAMDRGFTSIEQKESLICFYHPLLNEKTCIDISKSFRFHGRIMLSFAGKQHIALRVDSKAHILDDVNDVLNLYTI